MGKLRVFGFGSLAMKVLSAAFIASVLSFLAFPIDSASALGWDPSTMAQEAATPSDDLIREQRDDEATEQGDDGAIGDERGYGYGGDWEDVETQSAPDSGGDALAAVLDAMSSPIVSIVSVFLNVVFATGLVIIAVSSSRKKR